MYFDYDEPNSREEAKMISDFQHYLEELIDIDSIVEPSEKVIMGFELNDITSVVKSTINASLWESNYNICFRFRQFAKP